jgi:hypothetical protein
MPGGTDALWDMGSTRALAVVKYEHAITPFVNADHLSDPMAGCRGNAGGTWGQKAQPDHPAISCPVICRRDRKLRALQLSLTHAKIESPVRNLGIEAEAAIEIA